MDGPVGELMGKTNDQPHAAGAHPLPRRRARLQSLTTHLFQKGDQYIDTDVVFGVKEAADRRLREEAGRQGAERRD